MRLFISFTLMGFMILAVPLAFAAGFALAVNGAGHSNSVDANTNPQVILEEAWYIVKDDFYGELPTPRQRGYGAIRGLLDTLGDSYTVFIEPAPRQIERDDLRGSYGGIGAILSSTPEGQIVLSPFRDSPAAEAGILEGDILVAVDGLRITPDMDLTNDVVTRIRGEIGTDVSLTVQREEVAEELTFVITRQVINTPSVTWEMLEQAPALGYLRIQSFTERTNEELTEALNELLTDTRTQGLILDLRNNGGGLLQSAIDVSGQFLDSGTVLYENRRGQEEKLYPASQGGLALDVPLVVLVNHGTASASEIVAGAIQDRQRGALIGEKTFGKGTVQLIFDLNDGSSLHVTVAEWLTPDRQRIQDVGLTPDLAIALDPDNHPDVDLQLERAITYLLESDGD